MSEEGEVYRYGLPLTNKAITFRNDTALVTGDEVEKTILMNFYDEIFDELDPKDASYEQLVIRTNQRYNNEIDMYGDIKAAGDVENLEVMQYGVPIPHEILRDEKRMTYFRDQFVFNPDMPGAIENVHPNKFIASKKKKNDIQI